MQTALAATQAHSDQSHNYFIIYEAANVLHKYSTLITTQVTYYMYFVAQKHQKKALLASTVCKLKIHTCRISSQINETHTIIHTTN